MPRLQRSVRRAPRLQRRPMQLRVPPGPQYRVAASCCPLSRCSRTCVSSGGAAHTAPPNPIPNPTRVKEKLRTHCGTGSAFMHLTLLNEHDQVGVGVGVTVRVRVRVRVSTNPVIPNPTKP